MKKKKIELRTDTFFFALEWQSGWKKNKKKKVDSKRRRKKNASLF